MKKTMLMSILILAGLLEATSCMEQDASLRNIEIQNIKPITPKPRLTLKLNSFTPPLVEIEEKENTGMIYQDGDQEDDKMDVALTLNFDLGSHTPPLAPKTNSFQPLFVKMGKEENMGMKRSNLVLGNRKPRLEERPSPYIQSLVHQASDHQNDMKIDTISFFPLELAGIIFCEGSTKDKRIHLKSLLSLMYISKNFYTIVTGYTFKGKRHINASVLNFRGVEVSEIRSQKGKVKHWGKDACLNHFWRGINISCIPCYIVEALTDLDASRSMMYKAFYSLGENGLILFATNLKNTNVHTVDLSYNRLPDPKTYQNCGPIGKGAFYFLNNLTNASKVKDVDISWNCLTNDNFKHLDLDLLNASKVKKINFYMNKLTPKEIFAHLGQKPLRLDSLNLGAQNGSVYMNHFANNNIQDMQDNDGWLTEIHQLKGVKSVNLSENNITALGLETLPLNHPISDIEVLDLSKNRINVKSAVRLFKFFPKLVSLDLSGQYTDRDDWVTFLNQCPKGLRYLNLRHFKLTANHLQGLNAGFINSDLEEIDITNDIKDGNALYTLMHKLKGSKIHTLHIEVSSSFIFISPRLDQMLRDTNVKIIYVKKSIYMADFNFPVDLNDYMSSKHHTHLHNKWIYEG